MEDLQVEYAVTVLAVVRDSEVARVWIDDDIIVPTGRVFRKDGTEVTDQKVVADALAVASNATWPEWDS